MHMEDEGRVNASLKALVYRKGAPFLFFLCTMFYRNFANFLLTDYDLKMDPILML